MIRGKGLLAILALHSHDSPNAGPPGSPTSVMLYTRHETGQAPHEPKATRRKRLAAHYEEKTPESLALNVGTYSSVLRKARSRLPWWYLASSISTASIPILLADHPHIYPFRSGPPRTAASARIGFAGRCSPCS